MLPAKLNANMNILINRYGPIFKLKLGSWDAVFLTDYRHIKKAFQNPDLSFRPKIYVFELINQGRNHGISVQIKQQLLAYNF